jgi:hypothetical protein
MLDTFLSGVKQSGVTNYLIVALDQETAADLTGRGFNSFYMPIQVGASGVFGDWGCVAGLTFLAGFA